MKKLDLPGWAAIAEIVGTVAVVISLILVVNSVDRNTAQLQADSDNFLIQLSDEAFRDLALSPDLAALSLKFLRREELTDVETFRYQMQMARTLNRWEIAYVRYEQGFLDQTSWEVWDAAFSGNIVEQFPEDWWSEWKATYTPSFASHVDAIYDGSK